MPTIDLFIVAGEPSGDLQASKLIEELLKQNPSLKIGAVAGPLMRKYPIQTFFPMEKLQVMGFIDVFLALPKLIRQFFSIRNKILDLNPKALICVDYPGLNLRLARSLRKKKFPGKLIHFISPTVWAWGKKRIPLMEQYLDLLLTLFPFEKECFAHTKLKVEYVGHPLIGAIPPHTTKREKILALFPGSRTKEIERNFPMQLAVAKKMKALDPALEIHISASNAEEKIQSYLHGLPHTLVPSDQSYKLMKKSRLALATSGTVTLELCLHETPAVVNYAIRPLDLFLAQKLFKINLPFYCIVNIIASKEIYPELFGPNLTEKNLFANAWNLWSEPSHKNQYQNIRKELGDQATSQGAAHEILKILS